MDRVGKRTIDWQRAIFIDSSIDDELVKKLTSRILALRQESTAPITVGIDSPGGSLASLDLILNLLTGPDQNGHTGQIITVVTHRAYSAAANFLAFGTYSVALSHAQVLYHDVRFGGMEDVTPEKARDAAKSLQDANDALALRLAQYIIKRLVWIYIDLERNFKEDQSKYPSKHQNYATTVATYAPQVEEYESIDLASFATSLWARLSSQNDKLIENVMDRLGKWIYLTKIAKLAPTYRQKGSRIPGMLDGSRYMHKKFSGKSEHFQSSEENLKLLLSLIVSEISEAETDKVNFLTVLDRSAREFGILDSMNHPNHIRHASKLMLEHSHVFFGHAAGELGAKSEDEKVEIFAKAAPHARLLWHFCVLLCRELFEGEHILNPRDAQLLGLVDEVSGGGPIQSKREFWIEQAKRAAKAEKAKAEKTKAEKAKAGKAKAGKAKAVVAKLKPVAK